MNILEQEAVHYMGELNDAGSDIEAEEDVKTQAKKSMMEKINSEKVKRVTAKVKGVLKKMNKTYGGSIVKLDDMSDQTRKKFKDFLRNMKVD